MDMVYDDKDDDYEKEEGYPELIPVSEEIRQLPWIERMRALGIIGGSDESSQ